MDRLVNVNPPFVLTCHCTVCGELPVGAAVNVVPLPERTDLLAGESDTVGTDDG